ncbi:MAG: mercury methylation corrinoid protein HgcA [Acidaminobacteraceae bacterium]
MKKEERSISDKYIKDIIIDTLDIDGLKVPLISRIIKKRDKIASAMVRCGINRYTYEIPTGLYLLGDIEYAKDVIVTCNYRLTIDVLRSSIKSKGLFILVLDTFGINVWCAAGKSTFSSKELIYQVVKSDIKKKLKVRRVILPQLGASSIEPHIIRKMSGVSVVYGPVRAEDIDSFLENSYNCNEAMRTVRFPLLDRLKLTALEFIQSIKYILISIVGFLAYSLLFFELKDVVFVTAYNSISVLILSLIGAIGFPLAISRLPFKSFSLNNILLSSPLIIGFTIYEVSNDLNPTIYITFTLIIIRLMYAAFIGFRFTGSTTFTSFSGAKREGKEIVRYSKVVSILSVVLLFVSKVIG